MSPWQHHRTDGAQTHHPCVWHGQSSPTDGQRLAWGQGGLAFSVETSHSPIHAVSPPERTPKGALPTTLGLGLKTPWAGMSDFLCQALEESIAWHWAALGRTPSSVFSVGIVLRCDLCWQTAGRRGAHLMPGLGGALDTSERQARLRGLTDYHRSQWAPPASFPDPSFCFLFF